MAARNYLLKIIHCYPQDADLYEELMLLSLNESQCERQPILRASHSKVSSRRLTAASCMLTGDVNTSLREAQAAVHMNPGKVSSTVNKLVSCLR